MNRNIKFRVWHNQLKKFLPSDEWCLDLNGKLIFVESEYDSKVILKAVNTKLYTVQQFTGLIDKNKKEIYEGDILKEVNSNNWIKLANLYVIYLSNVAGFFPFTSGYNSKNFEIIGNIFENKELIK